MSGPPTVRELENDPRNPCIGCGPKNPVGLRLAFTHDGTTTSTALVASPNHQGWPGRLHSGVLYLALLETANWTVFALRERVGLPRRTSALETRGWVSVGETLGLTGRSPDPRSSPLTIVAEARDRRGELVARIERDYEFPGRAEFVKRMGYEAVPPELEGLLPNDPG